MTEIDKTQPDEFTGGEGEQAKDGIIDRAVEDPAKKHDVSTWAIPPERTCPSDDLPYDGYHIQLNAGHTAALAEMGLVELSEVYETFDADMPDYKQRVAVIDIRSLFTRMQQEGRLSDLKTVLYFIQQENVQSLNLNTALASLESVAAIQKKLANNSLKKKTLARLAFAKKNMERSLANAVASENFISTIPAEVRDSSIGNAISELQILLARNSLDSSNPDSANKKQVFSYLTETTPESWMNAYRAQYPITH